MSFVRWNNCYIVIKQTMYQKYMPLLVQALTRVEYASQQIPILTSDSYNLAPRHQKKLPTCPAYGQDWLKSAFLTILADFRLVRYLKKQLR